MEEISKQNKSGSHKEFEKLLSEDLGNRKFKEGEVATGTVEEIGKKLLDDVSFYDQVTNTVGRGIVCAECLDKDDKVYTKFRKNE